MLIRPPLSVEEMHEVLKSEVVLADIRRNADLLQLWQRSPHDLIRNDCAVRFRQRIGVHPSVLPELKEALAAIRRGSD